jgi:hypothetical protein
LEEEVMRNYCDFFFFLFTYEVYIYLLLSPLLLRLFLGAAGMLIFVLGLLLGSSNPAKEEEREFLNQTSSIFIIPAALLLFRNGRDAGFRAGFVIRFFKPSKGGGERILYPNIVIYYYHPASGHKPSEVLIFCRTK